MAGTTHGAATTPTAEPPHTYARRYGRTYRGLDNLTTASLCSRNVGRVRADCRLRVTKSQWGCLGAAGTPAAIVYMDIAIDQPSNCLLESAKVIVTLDEADSTPKTVPMVLQNQTLQMTDYYGPKQLRGEATKVCVTRNVHLVPQVNVMGSGGGGIGVEREKAVSSNSRWTFTGGLLPADEMSPCCRTLKWELRENTEGPGRLNQSPVIHTAFTLQHGDRPFIMRIKIQGRLQSSKDRLREKMRRLRFPNDPEQGVSDTLVSPNTVASRSRRLDMLAIGLPSAMERENLMSVAVEVPDALPVSFSAVDDAQPATGPARSSTPPLARRKSEDDIPIRRAIGPELASERLLSPADAVSIDGARLSSSTSDLSAAPTLVNTPQGQFPALSRTLSSAVLERAIDSNLPPEEQPRRKETPGKLPPLEISKAKEVTAPNPDQATLAFLLRYPMLLVILRFMAGVMDFLSGAKPLHLSPTTKDISTGDDGTGTVRPPIPGEVASGMTREL
ncbi:hypothetical protein BJX61DRAFT_544162 [Aspergillus egyptiacus]|nr:hypothetical protein BJX61DRAFT_544162 [Aspergillus egyptiacus]